jgi:RNA polymerase sigma-70 factor (ECF subfamily)
VNAEKPELSDEALIAAYRDTHDLACLDALVARHTPRLRGFLFNLVLDRADADDLTQEVFLRACRGLDTFRRQAKFSTWLYRIAVNTANSFRETRGRSPLTAVVELPETPGPTALRADEQVHGRERDATIREALAALSLPLRTALVLTAIEELPIPEAARRAACPLATFYWRLHQARKQFRRELARRGVK